MKKLLAAALAATLLVTSAVAFAACTGAQKAKTKLISISLSNEQYGIAVKKGNTELLTQINGVLTELTGNGVTVNGETKTFSAIYDAEIAAQEKHELISIGTVKTTSTNRANEFVVATNAEFAPFEYMVGESFGGIDMQVAKIIADKLGKELVVRHMDFEAVIEEVASGKADAAMAGLTINDERKEAADFSVDYYNTTQYIAVKADDTRFDACEFEKDVIDVLKSLPNGTKAGAAKAQTGYFYLHGNEDFEFDGYENLDTTAYPSIALAVQDLANGKIELVCGDKDTLTAAVNAVNK